MFDQSTGPGEVAGDLCRILGHVRGECAGPCLIALAGIHGNEPSGVEAVRRVLGSLKAPSGPALRGELYCIAGNLTALRAGNRFVHLDLNRQWTPAKVDALLAGRAEPAHCVEHGEQLELLRVLQDIAAGCGGPVHFLDMHTSSAAGPPFLTVGDTMRNRRFAQELPLPLILGLEEQVDGALLEYLNNFGFVTMGVEGGQHDSPTSRDCHESVLWLALVAAGLLEPTAVPDHTRHVERLRLLGRGAPRIVEVRRRHAIRAGDGFRMRPGFVNFQPVTRGQILADDADGPVAAPDSGRVLLPLYQGQGDDGFFVSREVRPFWLEVSAALRRFDLARFMRWLPGVVRDPEQPDVLVIDTRVARVYPLEVFHLLGFRKVRQDGPRLLVSRRRFDLAPPPRVELVPDVATGRS